MVSFEHSRSCTKRHQGGHFSGDLRDVAALDIAIISLGAVTVGIYPTLPANQVRWLIQHSEAHVLIADNVMQWERLGDLSTIQMIGPLPIDLARRARSPANHSNVCQRENLRKVIAEVEPLMICARWSTPLAPPVNPKGPC